MTTIFNSEYQEILQTMHGIFNPNGGCLAAQFVPSMGIYSPVCGNKFNNGNGCRIKKGVKSPCLGFGSVSIFDVKSYNQT